jgi:hypothetical protein
MIEECASGWPEQDKHTNWENLVSRVRKTRYLVKKNDTKTTLANEWGIYDSFVTLREGTKTGQMLLYKRTRHERRGKIKRKRDLVK